MRHEHCYIEALFDTIEALDALGDDLEALGDDLEALDDGLKTLGDGLPQLPHHLPGLLGLHHRGACRKGNINSLNSLIFSFTSNFLV